MASKFMPVSSLIIGELWPLSGAGDSTWMSQMKGILAAGEGEWVGKPLGVEPLLRRFGVFL